jgi:hypothetical protein
MAILLEVGIPMTIIDGEIKVTGNQDFPWIFGQDLYVLQY